MAFTDILDRHHDCEVVIIPRYHKNRPNLIPGLYCCDHCKLIKWLSPEMAKDLVDMGVEQLQPVKRDQINLMRQKLIHQQYRTNIDV